MKMEGNEEKDPQDSIANKPWNMGSASNRKCLATEVQEKGRGEGCGCREESRMGRLRTKQGRSP